MDPLTIIFIIIAIVILAFGVPLTIRAYRRKVYTGREELVGRTGLVKEDLAPQGIILVDGELWTAVTAKGSIKVGEEVVVNKVLGFKLEVSRKE
jgi:membrane-bound serine protease (ClpP class)